MGVAWTVVELVGGGVRSTTTAVRRLVRSTSVATAEGLVPITRSPSPCPGTGAAHDGGGRGGVRADQVRPLPEVSASRARRVCGP